MRNSFVQTATLCGLIMGSMQAFGQSAPPPARTAVFTSFSPTTHGFEFANEFQNFVRVVDGVDFRTGGLCGGMSYAALDYYFAGKLVPQQAWRPAEGKPLQSYIFARQEHSLYDNLDKWIEVIVNPFGWRNSEFFKWGLQGDNGGRIEELRAAIDAGRPVPLGLKGAHGSGDHQVIAFGYDMGRYRGDLGDFQTDFRIFILDPNYPNQTVTMVADPAREVFYYLEQPHKNYQTYFVDEKYRAARPIEVPQARYPVDGRVYELDLDIRTGADDMRGGNDNLSVIVTLMDGSSFSFPNVNLSQRWISNYNQVVELPLPRPIRTQDIYTITLSTSFGGGVAGDNWDMAGARVFATPVRTAPIANLSARRFTGDARSHTYVINRPIEQVTTLNFDFETGGDDLRGGNDNINITVVQKDGTTQTYSNINKSAKYSNNSRNTAQVVLTRPIRLNDLASIFISTTFGGGMGGDNWNMSSVTIRAQGSGINRQIARHGAVRFTGSQRSIEVPVSL